VGGFQHRALFYSGDDEYLAGTVPFIREGLEAGEPILAAVGAAKGRLLQAELGDGAGEVQFADMAELGRNPARIIPAWREFVGAAPSGRTVRGIGEPIWPGRSREEIVECHHHESLINLAFEGGSPWKLLCPYDGDHLDPEVLEAARTSHPTLCECGAEEESDCYGLGADGRPFVGPLSPAPPDADVHAFNRDRVPELRHRVLELAAGAGFGERRAADLGLAVSELAANSVRHAGGAGIARLWLEGDVCVCEVHDDGRIEDPLVGRRRPTGTQLDDRGLWLVNQLCDLVQIRSNRAGTIVRIRMHTG
jgi:anti-sigma regulatory factor (Ser/Thr protein kinase)